MVHEIVALLFNVKCWDVRCHMHLSNDVITQRPNNPIELCGHLVVESFDSYI